MYAFPPPPQQLTILNFPVPALTPVSSGFVGPYSSPLDGFHLLASLTAGDDLPPKTNDDVVNGIPASNSFSSPTFTRLNSGRPDNNSLLNLDRVERILDANTIQLKRTGVVRLAMVRMPGTTGNFQFPDCFTFSPSYKIRQLIPKSTAVRVQMVGSASTPNNNNPPTVVLIRDDDSLNVNRELIRTGFAKVTKASVRTLIESEQQTITLDLDELLALQNQAQANGLGIFLRCDAESSERSDGGGISNLPVVEARFEPLERTMETVWTDDGGKLQLRTQTSKDATGPPNNPGDAKGCSDFKTYEDALRWFEKYEPYYGDVAKLDRDGDGVPCPGLPHTSDGNLNRMKIPKTGVTMGR
ncbi:Excalibur calcium-binding domain containing protein [Nitzschia inconspicua]|uniref:Excalibur calcium-binding domain containing protein n=1 Tax=Nitzschia inconspicua TaxID=303405 RepID=A0A9K3LUA5_9STRA|nr:Excalibur calcium-binding domain containing protein [Nitzschia inconspicua]